MTVASAVAQGNFLVSGRHTQLSAMAQLIWWAPWWLWQSFPIHPQVSDICTSDADFAYPLQPE